MEQENVMEIVIDDDFRLRYAEHLVLAQAYGCLPESARDFDIIAYRIALNKSLDGSWRYNTDGTPYEENDIGGIDFQGRDK